MGRLSQDREEREAQLREYAQDLRPARTSQVTTHEPDTSNEKVTIGQIALLVAAVVGVIYLTPYLLGLIFGTVAWLLSLVVRIAILGGIGYAVWYFFFKKKRRY